MASFYRLSPQETRSSHFSDFTRESPRGSLGNQIKDLTNDHGVKKLIEKLDSLYLEDINQSAYAAYESFEMYRIPKDMNMKEFLCNFERLYNKLKVYQMELPD